MPCINEIPAHNKLIDSFAGRDIQFISVSIHYSKNDWKAEGLNKHRSGGLQLWAGDQGWESQFATDYMLNAIPKYIIIDRQGNVIDFDAPRPSDKGIFKQLSKAL